MAPNPSARNGNGDVLLPRVTTAAETGICRPTSCPNSRPNCSFALPKKNLRLETERLKTFENEKWNIAFLNSVDLARNGFYYTGVNDIVRCAFCGVEIGFWVEGDDPLVDHFKWSPSCPFLEELPCGNVTSTNGTGQDSAGGQGTSGNQEEEPQRPTNSSPEGQDVCGPWDGHEIHPFSAPERTPLNNLWRNLENLGVSRTNGPSRPEFCTIEARLKTFVNWPEGHPQSPDKLAEAGFFFTGIHDQTVCFHCGGGLKDWEPNDDPWGEHARWFSRCAYVLLQKGREFVNQFTEDKTSSVLQEIRELNLNSSEDEIPPTRQCEETEEVNCVEVVKDVAAAAAAAAAAATGNQGGEKPNDERNAVELCVICCSRDRSVVFLPCGHFVTCETCAPSLTKCPMCRKLYKGVVRAYLS